MAVLPLFILAFVAIGLACVKLLIGSLLGLKRKGAVKRTPYESGMDPVDDAHRRFDVRFHLVAIAFLIFGVELFFLYPWAVASRNAEGINRIVGEAVSGRSVVFGGAMFFLFLGVAGLVYGWRKWALKWRQTSQTT